ncbi:Lrp/AsnC family transcriptional regulator [Paenibacillus sedimenti]|uniref:Lrp/AsnC family transcriptional regulator n=1 Tax=Paenibacillus sedimenti TaxID=2770274 RepID=A0A926KR89_9BACL|nr:Lrp/AsnC family transcriptional regulator [Paenibacillus sedimenti]MBD0382485.1 Lrp/AsnC family transcriptional regulator [Paenibacillus sedimenti]
MDDIDKKIIEQLQDNARLSMTELGKIIGLTSPAVTERVRKLEDAGVIVAYRAIVAPDKLEKRVIAYILMETEHCKKYVEFAKHYPDVVETHRITGAFSYLTKIVTPSVLTLEAFIDASMANGKPTTLIVLSSPVEYRPLIPETMNA